MAETFGESILLIKADDAALKTGLKNAESAVVSSNAKMNKSMTGLKSTTAALGAVGSRTASAMGTVGAAAGVVGGATGAAIAPVAGLAGAIGGLAAPVLGVAAAVAVLGAILVAAFKPSIITDWLFGVKEANEQLKEGQQRLKAQRDEITKLVRLQEQRLQIVKGIAVASDFISNTAVRNATKAAEAALAAKAHKASTDAIADATAARVIALQQETSILKGTAKAHDFIKNAMEREAVLARDKARSEQLATEAVKAQAQIRRDARAAEGPQTGEAARLELTKQIAKNERASVVLARRRVALESALARGIITRKEAEKISGQFGLGRDSTKPADFTQGGRSAGVLSRSFTDIASIGQAGGSGTKKRESQLAELIRVGERTVRAVENSGEVLN